MENQEEYYRQMENDQHQQDMVFNHSKIEEQFVDIATLVEDGNESALDAMIFIKRVKGLLDELEGQMKPIAIDEANQYAEKTFGYKGAEITKLAGHASYSFKHISKHEELKDKIKSLENESKAAYQALLKGRQYVTDDGEVIEPAEVKFSADTISIKLSK